MNHRSGPRSSLRRSSITKSGAKPTSKPNTKSASPSADVKSTGSQTPAHPTASDGKRSHKVEREIEHKVRHRARSGRAAERSAAKPQRGHVADAMPASIPAKPQRSRQSPASGRQLAAAHRDRDDDESFERDEDMEERNTGDDGDPVDGLNLSDPGVMMLSAVLGDPRRCGATDQVLLVHCGALPGAPPRTTRLILDIRENEQGLAKVVPGWLSSGHAVASESPCVFDLAIVWPRAHLGKDFSIACLAQAGLALRDGGQLYFAARKQKGGKSLAARVEELFGAVEVVTRDRGYTLWQATRTSAFDPDLARQWLEVGYAWRDDRIGECECIAPAGVFSRKGLDHGTAALMEVVASRVKQAPRGLLDLGCGVGPLVIWAALRWPQTRALAVDSNILAAQAARHNVAEAGLTARVDVVWSDGLAGAWSAIESVHREDPRLPARGKIDLALVNPPTHAPAPVLQRLVQELAQWVAPQGRAFFVVSRAGTVQGLLTQLRAHVKTVEIAGYVVIEAEFTALIAGKS